MVRLGHRRDLAKLLDAANVAHVGIDDVSGAALEHLAKLEARVELLAGDDRDPDVPPAFGQCAHVPCRDRLLVPERVERLQHPGQPHRVHRGQPAVHLDQQVDLGPDRGPDGANRLDHLLLGLARDVRAQWTGKRIELERGEAARDGFLRLRRVGLR